MRDINYIPKTKIARASKLVETGIKVTQETIQYDDSVTKVMRKFKESGAWNLPVIKGNIYVGFISKSKLLTAYRNKLIEVTA